MSDSAQRDVLDFWFGALENGFPREARDKLWFSSSPETDRDIEARFGLHIERALGGGYADWIADPHGALALVLLLDQFTRNMYRGRALAFAGDARARSVARGLLNADLAPIERVFSYMPFEHSEAIADQELCVSLFAQLADQLAGDAREKLLGDGRYAAQHRDIIRRFGRFPHRNAVLGRESTTDEIRYLNSGGSRFGQ
jgi:uncharacterized protein (DUF924 family)